MLLILVTTHQTHRICRTCWSETLECISLYACTHIKAVVHYANFNRSIATSRPNNISVTFNTSLNSVGSVASCCCTACSVATVGGSPETSAPSAASTLEIWPEGFGKSHLSTPASGLLIP